MSKPKLTAVQREVLERMAKGSRVIHWHGRQTWYVDGGAINRATFQALIERGLVSFGEGVTTYSITDAGRAAIAQAEQTAGKEG